MKTEESAKELKSHRAKELLFAKEPKSQRAKELSPGFSLLELLIYMALIAIIMVAIIGIFTAVNGGRGRNEVQSAVNSNLRFAVEKIEDDLRAATSISTPVPAGISSNILQMTTASGTVIYCVSSGTLWRAATSTPGVSAWSVTTKIPAPLYNAPAVANNGYMYTFGGTQAAGGGTSTVYYAPINATGSMGVWSSTAALPNNGWENGPVLVNNNYFYLTGGFAYTPNAPTSSVFYTSSTSNGALNPWLITTKLPTSTQDAGGVISGGYIYHVGGYIAGAATSTVSYAPINATGSVGAWSGTAALPATVGHEGVVASNGYIYSIGGFSGGAYLSSAYYTSSTSNGALNAWQAGAALPSLIGDATTVVSNGYIYSIGGYTTGSVATTTVFYAPISATGSVGSWATAVALPSALGKYSRFGVAWNGYLYTVGGSPDNGTTNTSTVLYAPIICQGDAITDSTVLVNSSVFTRLENTNATLGKTEVSIQADLVLSYNGTGPDEQYSEEKVTTVAMRN